MESKAQNPDVGGRSLCVARTETKTGKFACRAFTISVAVPPCRLRRQALVASVVEGLREAWSTGRPKAGDMSVSEWIRSTSLAATGA